MAMNGWYRWYDLSVQKLTKVFSSSVLAVAVAVVVTGNPLYASGKGSLSRPSAESAFDAGDLRPPDPQKQLQYLSKNLKLTKHQRSTVDSILQERARQIGLLLDVQPLSAESRTRLAEKVIEDSNAQIEVFLKTKQRRKFNKELAKDHGTL